MLPFVVILLCLGCNVGLATAAALGGGSSCPSLQQVSSDLTQITRMANTDKFNRYHQYQFAYSHLFQCLRNDEVTFLEIGLGCDGSTYTPGASAHLWQTVFPKLKLYVIELDRLCSERVQPTIRGHIFIGSQADVKFLNSVTSSIGTGVDFIVDDGSHHVMHQIQTLNALYPTLLRPGGTYVVEDLLTSFLTGYGGNALGTGVTALAYMVQLVAGLVGVISLPYHMPDVAEVGCVNALCWVHKGPVEQASWRGGDCPSSANRSANQAAAAGLGELPPSVIRHLRCLEGEEASVLHVTYGSDENQDQDQNRLRSSLPPLLWEAYYPNSQVTRLAVHEGSPDDRFQRVHAAAVDVIVDDGTLPGGLQERAFSLLLQHSLTPGGLYLFQIPPSMGMGGKEALRRLMEKVIYEFYVWHEFRVQPWNAAVYYAGCGRSVCFVRKVLPWVRRASSREYFDHICQLGGGCIFAPQWNRGSDRSEVIRVNPPVPLEAAAPNVISEVVTDDSFAVDEVFSCPDLQEFSYNLTRFSANTDKFNRYHLYQFAYTHLFQCVRHDEVAFLEIGLGCDGSTYTPGSSALLWQAIFPKLRLYVIELDRACSERVQPTIRGHIFIGSQVDFNFLSSVTSSIKTGVDFIVDDGSHYNSHQIGTLKALFPTLLRPGGVYIVEDLLTSFMPGYGGNPTGKGTTALAYLSSLLAGLVGVSGLPSDMDQVIEVGCVNALCWLHKAPKPNARLVRGSDCPKYRIPRSRSKLEQYGLSSADLPPSILQSLRCYARQKIKVLHVTYEGSQPIPLFWEMYYAKSKVELLTVGQNTTLENLPYAANVPVIIDDGTLPTALQRRVFSALLQNSLAPGGLYVFQVTSSVASEVKVGVRELIEDSIYGFFLENVNSVTRAKYLNRHMYYVGCGKGNLCFVRKKYPWVMQANSVECSTHLCQIGGGCFSFQPT